MYNEKGIWLRNEVGKIEQLKPIYVYDFHEMNSIFENELGFNTRGCENRLAELGFNIPESDYEDGSLEYCDFWHYQIESVFMNDVINDSMNSIYVGTNEGINYKKFGKQPSDWQKMMLLKWNELFAHLADKNGWIKVYLTW